MVGHFSFDKWCLLPFSFLTSSAIFERLLVSPRSTLSIPIPSILWERSLIASVFTVLYFISYILDALDGVCARKFDQCT